jgi:hypothetical protein
MNEFKKTRKDVKEWLALLIPYLIERGVKVEVMADRDEYYRIDFLNYNLFMGLEINDADFAPYRFISLMMADIESDNVDFWYDKEGDTIEYIIENLDHNIKKIITF